MFIGSWVRSVATKGRHVAAPAPANSAALIPLLAQRVATSLPWGSVDVETETRLALTSLEDSARSRFVELQMAVEPSLAAQADMHECQNCLRVLMAAAISRAESGVLVTAMRRGDNVDIEILDDGTTAYSAIELPDRGNLPKGTIVAADYLPDQGTKVLFRLPYVQTAEAAAEIAPEMVH